MSNVETLMRIFVFIGFVSLFGILAAGDVPGLLGGEQTRNVTEPAELSACTNISGTVDSINCAFETGGQITGQTGSLLDSPHSWFVILFGVPFAFALVYLVLALLRGGS